MFNNHLWLLTTIRQNTMAFSTWQKVLLGSSVLESTFLSITYSENDPTNRNPEKELESKSMEWKWNGSDFESTVLMSQTSVRPREKMSQRCFLLQFTGLLLKCFLSFFLVGRKGLGSWAVCGFISFWKNRKAYISPCPAQNILRKKKKTRQNNSNQKNPHIVHHCVTVLPKLAVDSAEKIGRKYGQDRLSREMEKAEGSRLIFSIPLNCTLSQSHLTYQGSTTPLFHTRENRDLETKK